MFELLCSSRPNDKSYHSNFSFRWKKEHYHKGAFGTLQEAREANDGFAAAQKEYARLLTKSERAKKVRYELKTN